MNYLVYKMSDYPSQEKFKTLSATDLNNAQTLYQQQYKTICNNISD